MRARVFQVLVVLALLVAAAPSAVGAGATNPSEAQLYELFGVDDAPVHHILVVDVSSSMKGIFPKVRSALKDYLGLVRPEDRVSLVVFGDRAIPVASNVSGASASDLAAALPDVPEDDMTDIAAGLDAAVKEVPKANAPAHVIIMLTDGTDEQPVGSPLPRGVRKWGIVKKRADAVAKGNIVLAYGVGVGAKATGAPLLKRVFPKAESYLVSVSGLGGRLTAIREEVRRGRLRQEVKKELADGGVAVGLDVEPTLTADSREIAAGTLTVSSSYKRLPVNVRVDMRPDASQWREFAVTPLEGVSNALSVSDSIVLGPGETKSYSLAFTPEVAEPPWSFQRRTEESEIRFSPRVDAEVQFADVIEGLKLEPAIDVRPVAATSELRYSWGLWPWQATVVVLLLLVAGLVLLWLMRPPPPLHLKGKLRIVDIDAALGKGLDEQVRLEDIAPKEGRLVIGGPEQPGAAHFALPGVAMNGLVLTAVRGERRRELAIEATPVGYGQTQYFDRNESGAWRPLTRRLVKNGDRFKVDRYEVTLG